MTHDKFRIASKMITEFEKASKKFPDFHSRHEGYAVIKEELDEVWDAIRSNDREQAMVEMIQVGAMAIRFIQNLHDKNI
ncbi:MAG: hypothetical protein GWN62_16995 [Aliifodinibius sp.]|nr:hypothetical protein [Fodinibius sp.]